MNCGWGRMVVKKNIKLNKSPIKIVTANPKRLGCFGGHATFVKQEKRVNRRYKLPRKHDLGSSIEPIAIAILEAERHNNQKCRFNHSIEIDRKGRWVIDGKTIVSENYDEDNAGNYIRAARKLAEIGYGVTYMRGHPTLTDPEDDQPVSLTLRNAEHIIERKW